jgi:hypothetical protein
VWVTILLALGGAPIAWPAALGALVIAAVLIPKRFELTTFGALIAMLAGATVPILWARFSPDELGIALPVTLVLLGILVVRQFFERPLFGRGFDRALVGLACIAEGHGLKSPAYPWLAVLLALTLLVEQAGGARALRAFARTPRASFAVVGLAITVAGLGVVALPVLDRMTNRRFQALYEGRIHRTAFSAHVRLDQPGLISQSDEIVLRLHGAETDYLRGAIFDTFDGAYWTTSHHRAPLDASGEMASSAVTFVESSESSSWLFAPRNAKLVGDTAFVMDGLGALRPSEARGATRWAFAPVTGSERADPPADADRTLPIATLEDVRPLALAWTKGATDDREKVAALERHLTTDFVYDLDRPAPPRGVAPLHDFLFVHRRGHCEFFASAMVVLARSLGIPARLVAGFRVVEHNGYGGYAVVRAKHAHAWAEVYVPRANGGAHFEIVDATPPGVEGLAEIDPRNASAFFDWAKWKIKELYDDAFASPERSIGVLGGVIAIALVVRALRNRRRGQGKQVAPHDAVPAAFVRFEQRLAAEGFVRAPAETLEELAVRLGEAGREPLAAALRRYARARYGPGSASERELERALGATP